MRSGCPPAFHDDDIGVRLPDAEDSAANHSLFRAMAELALLESRVYSQLYSARGRIRSDSDRLISVARADKDLESWKGNLPVEIRPNQEIACEESLFMPVLMLHFSYFDCLETIHRASPYHQSRFDEKKNLTERPPTRVRQFVFLPPAAS